MKQRIFNFILRFFKKKCIIIIQDYIGIGNRIKQLASYHICFGLDNTWLFWKSKGWVNKSFDELFHIQQVNNFKSFSIKTPINLGVISYPNKKEFKDRGYWRLYVDNKDIFPIEYKGNIIPSIDFRYNDIPKNLIDKYCAFFDILKPSNLVSKRIEEVKISKNDVCVHIRNSVDHKDLANVPEISSFFSILDCYPSTTRFFISAMEQSIAKLFYDVYKSRIFELPNKDYFSMIDAVADLYLLSMGKELVLSEGSTFPEVAWWLGGGTAKDNRSAGFI